MNEPLSRVPGPIYEFAWYNKNFLPLLMILEKVKVSNKTPFT